MSYSRVFPGFACVLLFMAIPAASRAQEKLDIMSVKSVTLKYIGNDLNDAIFCYIFLTDAGHRLEIRKISTDEREVIMAPAYYPANPSQHLLHRPYESWFVKMQSPQGQYLIKLIKESLAALPPDAKSRNHLSYLIARMEQVPYAPGEKPDRVESMGEDF